MLCPPIFFSTILCVCVCVCARAQWNAQLLFDGKIWKSLCNSRAKRSLSDSRGTIKMCSVCVVMCATVSLTAHQLDRENRAVFPSKI